MGGSNGPLSNPPNFVWMRHARLDFMPGATAPEAVSPLEVNVDVIREDPEDRVLSSISEHGNRRARGQALPDAAAGAGRPARPVVTPSRRAGIIAASQ